MPDRVLAQIQAELDAGHFESAKRLCLSWMPVHGGHAILHAFLGYACQQTGAHEEAIRHCRDATDKDPASWLAFLAWSYSSQALGRLEEAREAITRAGAIAPADRGTLRQRLELEVAVHGVAAAFRLLDQAGPASQAMLSTVEIEEIIQRGAGFALREPLAEIRRLLNLGNPNDAELEIRQALRRFPDFAELQGLLAYCLQQQLRYEEAIMASCAATDVSANDWLALLARCLSLKALARHAEARAVAARAVQAYPGDVGFWTHLIETTLETRGFHAAKAAMASLPPDIADSAVGRSWRVIRVENGLPDVEASDGVTLVGRVETASDWAKLHDVPIIELGAVEYSPFEKPHLSEHEDTGVPVLVPGLRPYVVCLPDASIMSRSSLILTGDGGLINDVGADPEYGTFVNWSYDERVLAQCGRSIMVKRPGDEIVEIEGGSMLSGLASNAFGHWIPEFLGRLPWLEQHPDFHELPVIVDAEMPASHLDYLRMICDRPILPLPMGGSFRCRRLIYAPPPMFFPVELTVGHTIPIERSGMLSVASLRFLRDRVIGRIGESANDQAETKQKRWFLGRRNLKWRRLSNEAEIAAALEPLGFVTVYPEDMTLREQIALFQNADAIVAPNGSALLNLIFAKPDIALIILSQGGLFNWGGFQGPMGALGYRPVWVCSSESNATKHSDYAIAPSAILQALASLGKS